MSFRRASFTETRRRSLAKRVDRLDRLESRTTITEPISFTGLSITALRGLAQLGLMYPNGAASGLVRPAGAARQSKGAAGDPLIVHGNVLTPILDIDAGSTPARRVAHRARRRQPLIRKAQPATHQGIG